jgi:adenylate kinase
MSKLMIIRGLPGSGKSTLARNIWMNTEFDCIFEADMYFEDSMGNYNFDATKLYNAHKWCFEKVYENVHYEYDVIVANTFTTNKELKQYLELLDVFDTLEITVVDVVTQFESVHGVPQETMNKMRGRWQALDQYWIDRGVEYLTSDNFIF